MDPRLLEVRDGLFDLLFPPHCQVCGSFGAAFCPSCMGEIKPVEAVEGRGGLTSVASVGAYESSLRDAVLRLKYLGKLSLVEPLGQLVARLVEDWREQWRVDAIVPVPMHPLRALRRGFNQSELLAQVVSRETGLPMLKGALRATRRRPRQTRLDAAARQVNILGAFRVPECSNVAGTRLLLIDDVYTTGATLAECATELRLAGAIQVFGATLTKDVARVDPISDPGEAWHADRTTPVRCS